jgi:prevent-host-death family protein
MRRIHPAGGLNGASVASTRRLTRVMTRVIILAVEKVSKSLLKAKMLEYFRRVEETGEELVVTDNNVPVIRIVPIRKRRSASEVFADVRGRVVYHDDILAPTTAEWPET